MNVDAKNLPPVLTRADFDTDEEYEEYLEVERGDWVEAPDAEARKAFLAAAARATIDGPRTRISISVPDRTLRRIKARAIAEGLPYQTLINSILHKWLEGRG